MRDARINGVEALLTGTARTLMGLFLLLSLALLVVSCSSSGDRKVKKTEDTVPLSFAVSRTPLSAPFYIAQTKGWFAEQGLDARLVGMYGGHKCLKAVLKGEADMGTASELPVMFNSFERDDFVIAATFVTSYNDVKIIANRDRGIETPSDLVGKKVGIVPGSSSQFFLDFYLANNGISTEDVMTETLGPEKMAQALAAHRVDAVSVWEPFGFDSMTGLGDRSVLLPHDRIYRETFNLVVSRDFAEKNKAVLEKTLRALQKALGYIHEHREDAQSIIAAELDQDAAFIRLIWDDFDFGLQLDQSLLMTMEDQAKWAIKAGLVHGTDVPNFLKFIVADSLKKVSPAEVTLIN
jgi:ABC-type nitrate/sulfonate/bicarbonate transport system substrate-binding protein